MTAQEVEALAAAVRRAAAAEGLERVGVTRPGPSDHMGVYRAWLEADLHGTMNYLQRPDAVARRGNLALTLDDVRSVVVVADPYPHEDAPGVPDDPSIGVVARYARGRDYHKVLAGKLRRVVAALPDSVSARAYVDTGPILERDLARRAGLGWHGKNTMLLHPRRGSWCFLGVILLDAELPPDPSFEADHCGTCRACLDACPTGALLGRDASGAPLMDARRCISYLTIEHRGAIPLELRPLMGNRVFGCDICQEVCPFNVRFAEEANEPGYAARGPGERPVGVEAVPGEGEGSGKPAAGQRSRAEPGDPVEPALHGSAGDPVEPALDVSAGDPVEPALDGSAGDPVERALDGSAETRRVGYPTHPGTSAPSLVELMRMTRADWDAFSRGSAIRRAGYAGFRRNVAVAMGNWLAGLDGEAPAEAVAVLREALEEESELVREHVAWALGRTSAR